jgi:glycosyltransferase involved in cell wall biosynthesis
MKVSIITPSYNSALYIKNTIASVQAQTLRDWEMIIVDDGSIDNSADIIRDIAINDSRIKLIQKENGGSASARNVALSIAQGEYIQFLDSDDTIDYKKLERQITLMEKEDLDVSYSDWCFVLPDGTMEKVHGLNFNLVRILLLWGTLFGALPIHAFVYRRDFLTKHQLSFSSVIKEREDWNFHIQVLSNHPRCKRLKGYCAAYYLRCPTGKTSSFKKIQQGTLRFLLYKIHHTKFWQRVLLTIRLSVVLVELCMPTLKRKINIREDIWPIFATSFTNKLILIIAVMFFPISVILFTIRVIYLKLSRKHL